MPDTKHHCDVCGKPITTKSYYKLSDGNKVRYYHKRCFKKA
jgi:predicted nucleic acid-binding Zn ribbon protein